MYIVVAPDSFKESLSATKAAQCIAHGIEIALPQAKIVCMPMADGGEGTVTAMINATNGTLFSVSSLDPLGREIPSFYGVLGDGKTAVIEMAAASGLELLKPHERNPMITSTYGTGLLIRDAIEKGFQHIVLGIGGSATNDGGVGMAKALGYRFLDNQENEVAMGGGALKELVRIDDSSVMLQFRNLKITVASDVKNPLFGSEGASHVFAKQKGATRQMVIDLEQGIQHLARVVTSCLGNDYSSIEGSGAAGGLGFGLLSFLGAEIKSGFDVVKEAYCLEEHIAKSNLVFTAEGKIDSQTRYGKTLYGLGLLAKKHKVPVIALAGVVADGSEILNNHGITSIFAIADQPLSIEESMQRTGMLLTKKAEQLSRLMCHFL